jgi:hypothetical protein
MFFKEIIKKINLREGTKRIFLIIKIIWFLCFIFLAFRYFSTYQFYKSKINPTNIDIASAEHHLIISIFSIVISLLPIVFFEVNNLSEFLKRTLISFSLIILLIAPIVFEVLRSIYFLPFFCSIILINYIIFITINYIRDGFTKNKN